MGGNPIHIESSNVEDYKEATWKYLRDGGLVPFMQCIKGYDKVVSMQFVNSWNNRRVVVNGISFKINEDVISKINSFSLKGGKWRKQTRGIDEMTLNHFLRPRECHVCDHGGFFRMELSDAWKEVCYAIMRYLTLEGRFKIFCYYYFPILSYL